MVQENIIALDVGAPQADFDFESVAPKARFITPVPGGIGPLTVTCLLENAVQLATTPAVASARTV
jgi:methylenetetrahydrofolate dehydrogenase (NADP+)/methenyltetrahydrofolate cyclohydrolase